jgi:putative thiamine transport system permease protein
MVNLTVELSALTPGRVLAVFPVLLLGVLLLPMGVGLLGTLMPALGQLPVLGQTQWSLQPMLTLGQHPSFATAVRHTLVSGWLSPLLALVAVLSVLGMGWQSRSLRWLRRSLSTLLAIPHAAFAVGLVLLLGPSGWLVRMLSPVLTGWDLPPSIAWMPDPWGISLTLTLMLKEMPFLLLMALAGLQQLRVDAMLRLGRTYGYSTWMAWRLLIIPRLLPLLRLPMFAVIAYSISVVDVALIVGPSAPGTLAVLVDRWFNHPDILWRLPASAGAMLLLLWTGITFLLWYGFERFWCRRLREHASLGQRRSKLEMFKVSTLSLAWLLLLTAIGAFCVLLIWSVSLRWGFPLALPERWSLGAWERSWPRLSPALGLTLVTGLASAVVSLGLVLGTLEHQAWQRQHRGMDSLRWLQWLFLLPLLVPQIAFLFGVQVALIRLRLDGQWWVLLWSHLLYVIPYMLLSLAQPYRAFDERYTRQARGLGHSYWRALWQVKWPMLLRPILYAVAIGFAVSLAQYLPTLYVGAGRFSTLTTEVVTLGISADRRVLGVYAVVQWLLPMFVFSVALWMPRWVFRRRAEMQV